MDRFENLMNRYLDGSLSDEERLEFFQLVAEGEHADQVPDDVIEKIVAEEDFDLRVNNSFTRNYESLHATLNFKSEDVPTPAASASEGKTIPMRRSRFWYARAAAIIVIAMAAGVLVISKGGKWFAPFSAQQEVKMARYQGKQFVDLPDGTRIVLNANTELSYNRATFGKENREVNLTGEAMFDVAPNPDKPFLVHTGKVTTKVLGTEFNVKAFPDETITVTVLSGVVEVGDEQKIYGQIRPNEQMAVDVQTYQHVQQKTNSEEAIQWKSNFLILDGVSLGEAGEILGKKFNVRVKFENEGLKNCRFVGTFLNDETLDDVLSVMGAAMRMEFAIDKRTHTVTLSGKGCD